MEDGIEVVRLAYHGTSNERLGNKDMLTSPNLDLSNEQAIDLSFRLAYANHPDFTHDQLQVIVSTDCGVTFPLSQIVFESWADELAVIAPQPPLFQRYRVNGRTFQSILAHMQGKKM